MPAQKKYYAVRQGRQTGLFETWADCKKQIDGFPSAIYKSFKTREEAEAYLQPSEASLPEDTLTAYVDGSFLGGRIGYGVVLLDAGKEICLNGPVTDVSLFSMHNVAGEIEGARVAMTYALSHGFPAIIIYHDYEGVAAWCTGAWSAKLPGTQAYAAFYRSISADLHVEFRKVKGHSGDKYNDMADTLAKASIQ